MRAVANLVSRSGLGGGVYRALVLVDASHHVCYVRSKSVHAHQVLLLLNGVLRLEGGGG